MDIPELTKAANEYSSLAKVVGSATLFLLGIINVARGTVSLVKEAIECVKTVKEFFKRKKRRITR